MSLKLPFAISQGVHHIVNGVSIHHLAVAHEVRLQYTILYGSSQNLF